MAQRGLRGSVSRNESILSFARGETCRHVRSCQQLTSACGSFPQNGVGYAGQSVVRYLSGYRHLCPATPCGRLVAFSAVRWSLRFAGFRRFMLSQVRFWSSSHRVSRSNGTCSPLIEQQVIALSQASGLLRS
jgi:hypothetical protein